MEKVDIAVSDVSKIYKIYNKPIDRLKERVLKKKYYREFSALKNVSFHVKKGETVGIVGRNGSGKSTLLQLIAGTLKASSGKVELGGKVAALLELGSGFNPEYTGRENVYLCGGIYGITEKDMRKRFHKIEAFADIGDFIDQPVKTYSSGMFARLAFAVSINVDAEILIIDEILSVGDNFFQAKCMSVINQLARKGCTILLVSHSQATVKALCNRAILLNKGKVEVQGCCDEVFDRYAALALGEKEKKEKNKQEATEEVKSFHKKKINSKMMPDFIDRVTDRFGNRKIEFLECLVLQGEKEVSVVKSGEECVIRTFVRFNEDCDMKGEVGIVVRTLEGIDLFAVNSFFNNTYLPPKRKGDVVGIDFKFPVKLGEGRYSVSLGIRNPVQGEYADKVYNGAIFEVINKGGKIIPILFDIEGSVDIFGG